MAILPHFAKESEEYPSRVASQKHKIGGDLRQLPATFYNPEVYMCNKNIYVFNSNYIIVGYS